MRLSGLKVLEHVAKWYKSLAAEIFDFEGFEEAPAELALEIFDGAGSGTREGDRSTGAAVMSAGPAEASNHLAENLSRACVLDRCSHGENQVVFVDATANGIIDLLEPDHEIDDFSCLLRLGEWVDPAHHQPVVDE